MNNNAIDLIFTELVKVKGNELSLIEVQNLYLNRSKHTTRIDTYNYYKKHLELIIEYLSNIGITSTSQINDQILYKFIENERNRGLKNNTINKSLSTFKQALKYCEKQEMIYKSPMSNFELLSKDDIETVVIQDIHLEQILNTIDKLPSTPANLRNKFMYYLLIDTGIRLNELRQLKINDVDISDKQIILRFTKTKKNRTVFLSKVTLAAYEEYFNAAKPEEYIFIEMKTRKPISRSMLYTILRETKKNSKIPKNVSMSFHKFRHTYATKCLLNGGSLEFVRKTLGHSDISTTQKYLHLNTIQLQEEHYNCSPVRER